MAVEADAGVPGLLFVPGGFQHGPCRVPETDARGEQTAENSGGNDPAAPAAMILQPDSKHDKSDQRKHNGYPKLRYPHK